MHTLFRVLRTYRYTDDRNITMTTKAPSPVKPGVADSLEQIAYASVAADPGE